MSILSEDRICIPVPLYHCFGCVLGTLCAVVHGATTVFPHESFDAAKTLDAIEQERCTVIYGVPTMFIAQLEHESYASRDLSSLRSGIMAGSPCPIELMKRVTNEMGAREITIGYGQTEASPLITQTRTDDPIDLRVGGEEVLAWIKLRGGASTTETEIIEYCRARLAHFKAPKYVKFVSSFPTTVTGKIQKYKIREQAIRDLGLADVSKVETA